MDYNDNFFERKIYMSKDRKLGGIADELLMKAKTKAAQILDQDGDGRLNAKDASIVMDKAGNAVKKTANAVKNMANERVYEFDLKTLRPIFIEDLNDPEFEWTKLIRITGRDKRRLESEACKGSIGYIQDEKGVCFINIYEDSRESVGITYVPTLDAEYYYVDPSNSGIYIALDEYFSYLKTLRIGALQRIAQDLGAKHFRVTYIEKKIRFSTKKTKIRGKAAAAAAAEAEREVSLKDRSSVEIAAEMECPGHAPIEPEVHYLQREPSVHTLISLRMNKTGSITRQKLMLKMSNSSGIKEKDALKIDAILNGMKCEGNSTLTCEVQNESRRYLEYEIEF